VLAREGEGEDLTCPDAGSDRGQGQASTHAALGGLGHEGGERERVEVYAVHVTGDECGGRSTHFDAGGWTGHTVTASSRCEWKA
jgi:hypothetical protein